MSTTLQATSVVLYALAQHDPASPLVADALRYLMANRGASGAWASTYETAWSLMALARVMQATGELAGNFEFAASLNDAPLASGEACQASQLTPVTASAPVDDLYPDDPNALPIQRGGGSGRLYYTAHLSVSRPVEEVEPILLCSFCRHHFNPRKHNYRKMYVPDHTGSTDGYQVNGKCDACKQFTANCCGGTAFIHETIYALTCIDPVVARRNARAAAKAWSVRR